MSSYVERTLAAFERLDEENAKLREYITRLEQANIVLSSDNCDLRNDMEDMQLFIAENRKLRELVAKYSAAAKYLCGHSHCNECNLDCASVFDDVPSGWDCARMLLDKRARELGVEVD